MDCETNDCNREKMTCKGCYYDSKEEIKCEYCNSEKRIEERAADNIYCDIFGTFLRIQGKIFSINLGRVIRINYCPMCR